MAEFDRFQSLFLRADKPRFRFERLALNRVLLLGTQPSEVEALFAATLGRDLDLHRIPEQDELSLSELLARITALRPDLIVCARFFRCDEPHAHSLGTFVDVLAQFEDCPVLLLPSESRPLQRVMVMTDHLAGDSRLCSAGAHLTPADGELVLVHVEDDLALGRFMHAVERVPWIDTTRAREDIEAQLLKDPADWIEGVQAALAEQGVEYSIRSEIRQGHAITALRPLLEEHATDLLIVNTIDDGQLAMHGLAYAMAIEFTDIGVLLL